METFEIKPVLFGIERLGPSGAGSITLNRPQQLNALNTECYRLIKPKLQAWAKDPEVAFLLLEGAGDRAFCAGGDVKNLVLEGQQKGIEVAKEFFTMEYGVDILMHQFIKPTVAFLNGITMGGGIGFSRASRFKIVTEKTVMAMPETAIGLFPDVGATRFLHDVPLGFGLFMGLTGFRLQGSEAVDFGMANYYCPAAQWRKIRADLLRLQYGQKPPGKNRDPNHNVIADYMKQALPRPAKSELFQEWEAVASTPHFAELIADSMVSDNYFAWRDAFLSLRQLSPRLAEAQKSFATGSPIARRVFFEAYFRHQSVNVQEALVREWDMAIAFSKGKEFPEGVRAVLIDKDGKPKWQFARDEDVTSVVVAEHFVSGEKNPLSPA